MDVLTKKQRSYCMSQIRGRDTKPEVWFRKMLWAAGIRGIRTHAKIKGRPDIWLASRRTAIFVDGCFWHGCKKCRLLPRTNSAFWKKKFYTNTLRDKAVNRELRKNNIRVIRLWGHELNKKPLQAVQRVLLALAEKGVR